MASSMISRSRAYLIQGSSMRLSGTASMEGANSGQSKRGYSPQGGVAARGHRLDDVPDRILDRGSGRLRVCRRERSSRRDSGPV
jgi:hypothetical protein